MQPNLIKRDTPILSNPYPWILNNRQSRMTLFSLMILEARLALFLALRHSHIGKTFPCSRSIDDDHTFNANVLGSLDKLIIQLTLLWCRILGSQRLGC